MAVCNSKTKNYLLGALKIIEKKIIEDAIEGRPREGLPVCHCWVKVIEIIRHDKEIS